MAGILYSFVAGILVALQSVFNTKLSEKAGFWLTIMFVHASGLLVSLCVFLIIRDGQLGKLLTVNKLYLLGGTLGVLIIYSVMKGVSSLGPAYMVAILFTAQLLFSFLIDQYGWFGVNPVPFSWNKVAGIAILILGVVVYKIK
jgi:bacterial/archaeal transporter family-2 protein